MHFRVNDSTRIGKQRILMNFKPIPYLHKMTKKYGPQNVGRPGVLLISQGISQYEIWKNPFDILFGT